MLLLALHALMECRHHLHILCGAPKHKHPGIMYPMWCAITKR